MIYEGDVAHDLFIVCSGSLKTSLLDDQEHEVVVNIFGKGDYFGELSLLDDLPRSANVTALEVSELLIIGKPAFQAVVQNHPECQGVIVRELVARIRELTESVRGFALLHVFGRIVRLLPTLAGEEDGMQVIRPRLTHLDIAQRVGSSREMVSRILRDLVIGGYLGIEPERIVIHKKLPSRW